jgi:hypothetical protein
MFNLFTLDMGYLAGPGVCYRENLSGNYLCSGALELLLIS